MHNRSGNPGGSAVRAIRALALTIAACSFGLVVPGSAEAAETPCVTIHDVHPYSDNMGRAWQLEIDTKCPANFPAESIEVTYNFWAETQDGSRTTAEYSEPGLGTKRVQKGRQIYVAASAPAGEARYCYSAHQVFNGLDVNRQVKGGQKPLTYTGIHCRNA